MQKVQSNLFPDKEQNCLTRRHYIKEVEINWKSGIYQIWSYYGHRIHTQTNRFFNFLQWPKSENHM